MEQTNAKNLEDYQGPDEIEDIGNEESPVEEIK